MINKEELQIVRRELDRAKDPNGTYPTDHEVLLCMLTFQDLITVGDTLGLEMLSSWATFQHTQYSHIARARKLK